MSNLTFRYYCENCEKFIFLMTTLKYKWKSNITNVLCALILLLPDLVDQSGIFHTHISTFMCINVKVDVDWIERRMRKKIKNEVSFYVNILGVFHLSDVRVNNYFRIYTFDHIQDVGIMFHYHLWMFIRRHQEYECFSVL